MLSWKELQEVLSDLETTLNNRPLSYLEDDPQLPVLTPSSVLFVNSNVLPELQPHRIETADKAQGGGVATFVKRVLAQPSRETL